MFIIALFAILGIVFLCGKGSFLIAGYNTMSAEEKVQWDERALCKAVGVLILIMAGCLAVVVLSAMLRNYIFLTVSILLIFAVALGGVIFINTSKKLKRK